MIQPTPNKFLLPALAFLWILSGCTPAKENTSEIAKINTPHGEILIWLYDQTPKHKAKFIELATSAYWDSLTFNRVIPGFVAQAGCPDTEEGFGDSPYLLEPEFHDELKHRYGALGAGRDDNPQKLSAACQFYIVHKAEGIDRLDQHYTIYGQVIKGMDVVDAIVHAERDETDEPLEAIFLQVRMVKKSNKDIKDWMKQSNMDFQKWL